MEESYKLRSAFLSHLYANVYEETSVLGAAVRAVHQSSYFAFGMLRQRPTDNWPKLFASWKINGAPIFEAWEEWQAHVKCDQ